MGILKELFDKSKAISTDKYRVDFALESEEEQKPKKEEDKKKDDNKTAPPNAK